MSTTMNEGSTSREVLVNYFSALEKKDLETAVSAFKDDVIMVATLNGLSADKAVTGTYHGKQAVHSFLSHLYASYERIAFTIEKLIGSAEAFFAKGVFTFRARTTGIVMERSWAVYVEAQDGKIKRYQLYEESGGYK